MKQMLTQRMKQLFCLTILVALPTLGTPAFGADTWTQIYMNNTNNAVSGQSAQVTDVTHGPAWQTGEQSLQSACGITLMDGFCYAVLQSGAESWWETPDPTNDKVTVKAFMAEDGKLLWESKPLDVGNTVSFLSNSTPTVDPLAGVIYVPTGQSIQKLDARTGELLKAVKLDAANTEAGASYDLINGCPALGGGKVFIETYAGFDPTSKQIVALNASDLSVAWHHKDGGQGQGTPCYVDNGAQSRVYTATDMGIACYNAADGTAVWNSATLQAPLAPWATAYGIYGGLVYDNGFIYATTWKWSPTLIAEVIKVDAVTGELQWKKAAPSSSFAPLVLNGKVYVYGTNDTRLAAFDTADGDVAKGFNVALGAGDGWANVANYMAATLDRIYVTDSTKLYVVNPADGSIMSEATGAYNGPVSIDRKGGLYVHAGAGLQAFGQTVPVELSSFEVE